MADDGDVTWIRVGTQVHVFPTAAARLVSGMPASAELALPTADSNGFVSASVQDQVHDELQARYEHFQRHSHNGTSSNGASSTTDNGNGGGGVKRARNLVDDGNGASGNDASSNGASNTDDASSNGTTGNGLFHLCFIQAPDKIFGRLVHCMSHHMMSCVGSVCRDAHARWCKWPLWRFFVVGDVPLVDIGFEHRIAATDQFEMFSVYSAMNSFLESTPGYIFKTHVQLWHNNTSLGVDAEVLFVSAQSRRWQRREIEDKDQAGHDHRGFD
jgi:hypothetical protein